MTKMFPFITETWNPLGGECPHNCKGCWAKAYINRLNMPKYHGEYTLDAKQINKKFKAGSFVFVCDMLDLFAANVPMVAIMTILKKISEQPEVTFLLLTKNPRHMWIYDLPKNVVAGATIETEFDPRLYGFEYSKAPLTSDRIKAMIDLDHPRKFVSIEPIMDFSPGHFLESILAIKPEFVAIGFDNYNSGLPEPESLEKVLEFIADLESNGIKVYRKTIRDPIVTVI
jgi:protein gp37